MATPRKVREYVRETELEAGFMGIIQSMLGPLYLDQMSRGDKDGAFFTQFQSKFFERVRPAILQRVEKIVSETFSDEELDQLIAIHRLPVRQKVRDMFPEIQQEVVNLFSDGTISFRKIAAQIIKELD